MDSSMLDQSICLWLRHRTSKHCRPRSGLSCRCRSGFTLLQMGALPGQHDNGRTCLVGNQPMAYLLGVVWFPWKPDWWWTCLQYPGLSDHMNSLYLHPHHTEIKNKKKHEEIYTYIKNIWNYIYFLWLILQEWCVCEWRGRGLLVVEMEQ